MSSDGGCKETGKGRSETESETRAQEREGFSEDLEPAVSAHLSSATHTLTHSPVLTPLARLSVLEEASASQASSKKENRVDQSGKSRSYDIRIENFDVSFGER